MKEDMSILLLLASSLMISAVNSALITYNAALNRPAYQSSVHRSSVGDHAAHLANDGNRETTLVVGSVPTCTASNIETNPWWAVDLGRPTAVYRVDFTNRGDCCEYRSDNFIVGLTNASPVVSRPTLGRYTLCGQYPGAVPAGATVSLYCQDNLPPFKYVIIQFLITDHMNFCELEVLVRVPRSSLRNVALNKTSFQVSTYVDSFGEHSASLANDGSRQTNFRVSENGCAASNLETDPWWAVDLDAPTLVYEVTLTNRGDTAGYRSNSFIVGLTNSRPGPHVHALWNYTLCGQYPGTVPAGATVTVQCANVYERRLRFRYVIVQFPLINDQMNVCEVEVFAIDEEEYATDTTRDPLVTNVGANGPISTTTLETTTPRNTGVVDCNCGSEVFFVATIALAVIALVLAIAIVILLLRQRATDKSVNSNAVPGHYDHIGAAEDREYQEVEMSRR